LDGRLRDDHPVGHGKCAAADDKRQANKSNFTQAHDAADLAFSSWSVRLNTRDGLGRKLEFRLGGNRENAWFPNGFYG
jgi:hypothetical protein